MSVGRTTRKRRKLKAEINVVPYIDVMLVLLIIFMVTAPLLNLGVDIQLPQSAAKSIQNEKEPVMVSVDQDGKYFLTLGTSKREPIDATALVNKISAFIRENPQVPERGALARWKALTTSCAQCRLRWACMCSSCSPCWLACGGPTKPSR